MLRIQPLRSDRLRFPYRLQISHPHLHTELPEKRLRYNVYLMRRLLLHSYIFLWHQAEWIHFLLPYWISSMESSLERLFPDLFPQFSHGPVPLLQDCQLLIRSSHLHGTHLPVPYQLLHLLLLLMQLPLHTAKTIPFFWLLLHPYAPWH